MSTSVARSLFMGMCILTLTCFAAALFLDDRSVFDITAVPTSLKIGTLTTETECKVQGSLRNVGRTPALIRDVWSSCGCTTPSLKERRIAPGASVIFTATIKAGVRGKGEITRFVYFDARNEQGTVGMVVTVPISYSVSSFDGG